MEPKNPVLTAAHRAMITRAVSKQIESQQRAKEKCPGTALAEALDKDIKDLQDLKSLVG